MDKLALLGGKPVIKKAFKQYNTMGPQESKAAAKVIKSGVLSKFLGSWSKEFYGGPMVRKFENNWAKFFKAENAVSFNSATSGLYAAVGACGIGPGDEVIVTPFTMTATPSAILVYNAIPVFADIQKDIFTLDPQAVERGITKNTKAILAVHIFGHPCDLTSLVKIAKKHNLKLIEDCAQAPAATWDGKYVGQFGDIGVFSLNYHKHINSGEGGVCVTSAKDLAERLQLIRNHAEAVAEDKGVSNYTNLLGWNYRMTEVEAAIGNEQLKKLDSFVQKRIGVARQLDQLLKGIKGITLPEKYPNAKHVYYMYALKINRDSLGITRQQFLSALEAEGVNFYCGYTKPLYLQPMYQKKIVYGNKGCPFICQFYKGKTNYEKGICPVAEKMFFEELANFPLCLYDLDKNDVKNIANAIYKVVENKNELKNYA